MHIGCNLRRHHTVKNSLFLLLRRHVGPVGRRRRIKHLRANCHHAHAHTRRINAVDLLRLAGEIPLRHVCLAIFRLPAANQLAILGLEIVENRNVSAEFLPINFHVFNGAIKSRLRNRGAGSVFKIEQLALRYAVVDLGRINEFDEIA